MQLFTATGLALAALVAGAAAPALLNERVPTTVLGIRVADFAKLSPFTEVLVDGDVVRVLFEDAPHELVTINGVSTAELWTYCQAQFGSRAEKRLAEDLVEVLDGLGFANATHVDLELTTADGTLIQRADVAMTEANRARVWQARNMGNGRLATSAAPAVIRVDRDHATQAAPTFAWLAEPREPWSDTGTLTAAQAAADLDQLEHLLETEYSYRDLTGVDFRAALDAVRLGLGDAIGRGVFATRLGQVMARFGDGHSMPRRLTAYRAPGYAAFLVADTDQGPVAFRPDRSGFANPEHPFLIAIDERPLADWLAVAARTIPDGSPQFQRRASLRALRYLGALRAEAGWPASDTYTMTVANAAGETVTGTGTFGASPPTFGAWPRAAATRLLDENVGYLRIPSMASGAEFTGELEQAMERFATARGLIIDVRSNGGGSREALRVLLPYFLDPAGGPRVVNVGARRLTPTMQGTPAGGYLANRALYPADDARWSAAERAAIQAVAATFAPDWDLPRDAFSAWHYMVIAPDAARHFGGPVAVLMDTGCFSATDIFLAAFADATDATLMGTPSGGGSGRTQTVVLANSGVELRLSTMASFRADGTRYDGKGIAPDVLHVPTPGDLLNTDSLLDRAHAWVLAQAEK